MEQKTIEKIFDPFFTTKRVGEGTGLGLSVVQGIIERHNGMITVDSTPGKGSTFHLYFPICKIEENGKHETSEALPTGNEHILFVDDEECITDTCSKLLEVQGYKVTTALCSTEALEIFKANPEALDLVFTDQSMPEMSGAELAIEVLKIRPDLPIILCSGYSAKISERGAKNLGIREFCIKPMNMEKLATVVRRVLDESDKRV